MQNLVSALAAFHADVGRIVKGSKAQYGLYADLATVLATVTPSLAANGLVVTQTFNPWDGGYTILRTTLAHTSGESITSDVLMPQEPNARNQLHAFGAACTYLRRYALLAILNLAAEDDDGESFARDTKAVPAATRPSKPRIEKTLPIAQPAATAVPDSDSKLTADQRDEVIGLVKTLSDDQRNELLTSFRTQFNLAQNVSVAEHIRDSEHAAFIRKHLNGAAAAV